jgi:hypothetical protein
MTGPTDYPSEIDVWTADDLISGTLPWIDVPDGYEGLSDLVSAVRRGVAPEEPRWGSPTVAAMAARIATTQAAKRSDPRRRLSARRVPHLAAAMSTVVLLSSAAAAIAGELPAPMQVAASDVARIVGVSVPATHDPGPTTANQGRPGGRSPNGGSLNPAPPTAPAGSNRPNALSKPASSGAVEMTSSHANESMSAGPPAAAGTSPGQAGSESTTTSTSTPSPSLPPTQPSVQLPPYHGSPAGSNSCSPAGSNSGRGVGPGTTGGHSQRG